MEHTYLMCRNNKECIKNVITVRQQRIQFGKPTLRCAWPRGLRRRYAVARLLRLWVRIQPGHGCLSVVSVVCCQVEVSATS
jgi:hypothetical protein